MGVRLALNKEWDVLSVCLLLSRMGETECTSQADLFVPFPTPQNNVTLCKMRGNFFMPLSVFSIALAWAKDCSGALYVYESLSFLPSCCFQAIILEEERKILEQYGKTESIWTSKK